MDDLLTECAELASRQIRIQTAWYRAECDNDLNEAENYTNRAAVAIKQGKEQLY